MIGGVGWTIPVALAAGIVYLGYLWMDYVNERRAERLRQHWLQREHRRQTRERW